MSNSLLGLPKDSTIKMLPKRTSSVTNMLKHKTSVSNKPKQKVKDVGNKTRKPKSMRVQKRQPVKVAKQTTMRSGAKKMLATQKGKSTTASQRLKHVDQAIDDVALGHVCVNGQDNPDVTSLVAGPVTTPVNTCPGQGSNMMYNGGNVVTLQECAADAEVHAAKNDRLLRNGNTMNATNVNQQDAAANVELQQRPIFNERDLSNALRSVFGSFSNGPGQSQVSVGIAPRNGDGRPMTSPRDAVPTSTNMPATSSGTTVTMSTVPNPNEGPVDLSMPQQNVVH